MDVEILTEEVFDEGRQMRVSVRIAPGDKVAIVREAELGMAQEARITPGEGGDIRTALEHRFGAQNMSEGITSYVAAIAAASVVNQRGLHIMYTPEPLIDAADQGDLYGPDPWTMDIGLVLRPEFDLSDYGPVAVSPGHSHEVTDEMVAEAIGEALDSIATMEPEPAPLAEGDYAIFDMETVMNGSPAPNLSGTDMHIMLAPDMMPRGFIDAVVGMEEGEERDFKFASSEMSPSPDAVPDVFQVHAACRGRFKRVVPELTDDVVKEHFEGAGSTVEEYRGAVRAQLEDHMAAHQREELEMQVDSELAKRLVGPIDDLYMERTRDDIMENMLQQLAADGLTLEQFASQQGMQEQQFTLMVAMQARESLRQGFALDAYWRHMDAEVTQEDMDHAISVMSPGREAEAKAIFDRNGAWFVVVEMAQRLRAHDDAVAHAVFE